jgi:hypothetical protein
MICLPMGAPPIGPAKVSIGPAKDLRNVQTRWACQESFSSFCTGAMLLNGLAVADDGIQNVLKAGARWLSTDRARHLVTSQGDVRLPK